MYSRNTLVFKLLNPVTTAQNYWEMKQLLRASEQYFNLCGEASQLQIVTQIYDQLKDFLGSKKSFNDSAVEEEEKNDLS